MPECSSLWRKNGARRFGAEALRPGGHPGKEKRTAHAGCCGALPKGGLPDIGPVRFT